MRYTNNLIPNNDLNDVINYIDTKYSDLLTLIQDLNGNMNSIQSNITDLQTVITNISNTLPSDLADTINDLGTEFDFENGIRDSLSNQPEVANTLIYKIGYKTGEYIKKTVGQKQVYVSPINGDDTNPGTNQSPVVRLSRAINLASNSNIAKIEIFEAGTEEFQNIYTLEKGKSLEIFCDTSYYDFSFGIVGDTKSKLIVLDYDKVVFKNIRFIQNNLDTTTTPLSLENAVFFFDSSKIHFVNCEFISGTTQVAWTFAKNSRIILDNCNFPDSNGNSVFLNSADDYPNEIITINSYIGSSTNLTDGNPRNEVK